MYIYTKLDTLSVENTVPILMSVYYGFHQFIFLFF